MVQTKAECYEELLRWYESEIKSAKELATICDHEIFVLCVSSHFDQNLFNDLKSKIDKVHDVKKAACDELN